MDQIASSLEENKQKIALERLKNGFKDYQGEDLYKDFVIRTSFEHLLIGSSHAGQGGLDPNIPLSIFLGGDEDLVREARQEIFKTYEFGVNRLDENDNTYQIHFKLLDPQEPASRDNIDYETLRVVSYAEGRFGKVLELNEQEKKDFIDKAFAEIEQRYKEKGQNMV